MPSVEQWIQRHEKVVQFVGASSLVMFLGTLIVLIVVIVILPPEHFVRDHDRKNPAVIPIENQAVFFSYQILKNLIGILFILAGLVMLVLPGQGLMTLVIGLSLTSFPGKRRLIQVIIERKAVLTSANWLRRKFGRPPLKSP